MAKSFRKLGQRDWAAPATLLLKVGPFSQMAWTRSRADGCTSCTVADRWAATSTRLASTTSESLMTLERDVGEHDVGEHDAESTTLESGRSGK